VRWAEVVEVLDALERRRVRLWLAGGWGVDALVGVETRLHRDVDLAVDAEDYDACMAALSGLHYTIETDWLPLRVELVASGDRWVDVHPVRFDVDGLGVQGDLEGTRFLYPPTAFTTGRLRGRSVACLSARQQELFHRGYEPRPQDEHDLRQLRTLGPAVASRG
jgi:lincosamide nucleotidyltransferase A/C/D/E